MCARSRVPCERVRARSSSAPPPLLLPLPPLRSSARLPLARLRALSLFGVACSTPASGCARALALFACSNRPLARLLVRLAANAAARSPSPPPPSSSSSSPPPPSSLPPSSQPSSVAVAPRTHRHDSGSRPTLHLSPRRCSDIGALHQRLLHLRVVAAAAVRRRFFSSVAISSSRSLHFFRRSCRFSTFILIPARPEIDDSRLFFFDVVCRRLLIAAYTRLFR